MSAKYIVTPISVAIHLANESPIYGDNVTTVRIDDEAAGPFIKLNQNCPGHHGGEVSFNTIEELATVMRVAKKLMAAHEKLK